MSLFASSSDVTNFFYKVGTEHIALVNEMVKTTCEGCKQVSWKYKGFWNSQKRVFRDDGIHLNYKLFRSFRGAIPKAASVLSVHGR